MVNRFGMVNTNKHAWEAFLVGDEVRKECVISSGAWRKL